MLVDGAADQPLDTALESFAREGFARLGVVASDATLAALRSRADEFMLGTVTYPGLFFQMDSLTGSYGDLEFGKGYQGPSLDYRKIEKLELDPLYLAWIENPLFARIAAAVIGGDVTLYRSTLFAKSARGGTVLPWHQDGGRFWGIDRNPILQIWTALDDMALDSGCVEVVPRSHLGGLVTPNGGQVADATVAALRADEHALPLPAKAGEVLLIHNQVWHRSGINHGGRPRRAVSSCYMSAETRCLRTKRAPRTFFRLFQPRS
jgi:phytanoyl-CoA hydroxylase